MVLNPVPRRRKRTRQELWKELEMLDNQDPAGLIIYHLRQTGIRGLTQSGIAMRSGIYGKPLERTLEGLFSSGKAIRIDADEKKVIDGGIYRVLKEKVIELVNGYHIENPLSKGIPKEEIRSRIFSHGPSGGGRLFQKLLTDLVNSSVLVQDKDLIWLATHKISLGEEDSSIRRKIEDIYQTSGFEPPSRNDALTRVSPDQKSAARIFDLLVREGVLVRLKEDIYYHRSSISKVKEMVTDFLKKNGEMALNDFRDLAHGLSRKYMIPLLEYLDNQKITIRVGDKRKLRG